ncbi:MAG: hypothetical protein Q4P72_06230 [Eubacteriales bacterium]|nr:hypothetical protein [Eubacteriales bacterium]
MKHDESPIANEENKRAEAQHDCQSGVGQSSDVVDEMTAKFSAGALNTADSALGEIFDQGDCPQTEEPSSADVQADFDAEILDNLHVQETHSSQSVAKVSQQGLQDHSANPASEDLALGVPFAVYSQSLPRQTQEEAEHFFQLDPSKQLNYSFRSREARAAMETPSCVSEPIESALRKLKGGGEAAELIAEPELEDYEYLDVAADAQGPDAEILSEIEGEEWERAEEAMDLHAEPSSREAALLHLALERYFQAEAIRKQIVIDTNDLPMDGTPEITGAEKALPTLKPVGKSVKWQFKRRQQIPELLEADPHYESRQALRRFERSGQSLPVVYEDDLDALDATEAESEALGEDKLHWWQGLPQPVYLMAVLLIVFIISLIGLDLTRRFKPLTSKLQKIEEPGDMNVRLRTIDIAEPQFLSDAEYRKGHFIKSDSDGETAYERVLAGETIFKGSGREEDPYLIESAEDLVSLAELVNLERNGRFARAYFRQTADIVLNPLDYTRFDQMDEEDYLKLNLWKPIGSQGKPFRGVYDGDGHSIRGLYYNHRYEGQQSQNFGFFTVLDAATVKNVIIKDALIYAKNHDRVGVLAARAINGSILESIDIEARIVANGVVAGLVAEMKNSETETFNQAKHVQFSGSIENFIAANDEARESLAAGLIADASELDLSEASNHASIRSQGMAAGLVGSYQLNSVQVLETLENTGLIEARDAAAGLFATLSFKETGDATLKKLTNSGKILSPQDASGLIAKITLYNPQSSEHSKLRLSHIEQIADIEGKRAAGLSSRVLVSKNMYFELKDFDNRGSIYGETIAAGVLADFSLDGGEVEIENLKNTDQVRIARDAKASFNRSLVAAAYVGRLGLGYDSAGLKFKLQKSENAAQIGPAHAVSAAIGEIYWSALGEDKRQKATVELNSLYSHGELINARYMAGVLALVDETHVSSASQNRIKMEDIALYDLFKLGIDAEHDAIAGLYAGYQTLEDPKSSVAVHRTKPHFEIAAKRCLFGAHFHADDTSRVPNLLRVLRRRSAAFTFEAEGIQLENVYALPYVSRFKDFAIANVLSFPKAYFSYGDGADGLGSDAPELIPGPKSASESSYPGFDFKKVWQIDSRRLTPVPRLD